MKPVKHFLNTVFIFALSCGGTNNEPSQPISLKETSTILIPLYSYPNGQYSSEWDKLINFQTKKEVVVIINPDNGPGNQKDDNFGEKIKILKNKGFKVIGYVYTNYGSRDLNQVYKDIDSWFSFYPDINGIFLDEVVDKNQTYYSKIADYIKSKNNLLLTVGNPGTEVNLSYLSIFDRLIVFENSYNNFINYNLKYKYSDINPSKVCILIYAVLDTTSFEKAKSKGLSNNIGCQYLTDKNNTDLYFKISSFLDKT